MDNNMKALLHVHGALLASLCATHPNPKALGDAFTFHIAQVGDVLQSSPEMTGLVNAWARTYRRHFAAIPDAGDPPP
jgi:hypothetical protein